MYFNLAHVKMSDKYTTGDQRRFDSTLTCLSSHDGENRCRGVKLFFLLTRPAGLVGGKSYSPSWHYHSPLITDHTCT